MYWIVLAVLGIFLLLFLCARKERPPEDAAGLLKPFYKIALFLYKRIGIRFAGLFASRQVETDLAQLHPGEAREYLKAAYYVKKIAICLTVVFVGTLLGGAVRLAAQGEIILGEDGRVPRSGSGPGSTEITIAADYGERRITIQLPVEFRKLSQEEANELFEELLDRLPRLILGDNESLEAVNSDLKLERSYEGYPFALEWKSGDPEAVSSEGIVYAGEEPRQVILSLEASYEGYRREAELSVTVRQPELGEEERLYEELRQMVFASEESSRGQDSFQLPGAFRGQPLGWRQVIDDNSVILWLAAMAAAVAVYLFSDRDLHDRLEKQKGNLKREYPELVHKLVLFVGAGMTIRGAFLKIAGDYTAGRKVGEAPSPSCEEVLRTCRELHSGVSEGAAYEHFGKRTGLQEYIRLCTLLTQNLKRGNSMLLDRLREEADKAAEERLQQSRKLGEEAGTKLMIPMVMMLAVIMAMIMIPAFSGL